jgi:hypothetical protein
VSESQGDGRGPIADAQQTSAGVARLDRAVVLPGVLTALGGVCQLVGLALVVKEIVEDRRQARRLFVPRPRPTRPRRRYPGKALPRSGALTPFESLQTAARQQQALRETIRKIDAAVYNALIEMRESLDTPARHGGGEAERGDARC